MQVCSHRRARRTGVCDTHLDVSDPQLSLHVVADHKVSQDAAGGDAGLLDDVWAEGDPPDVVLLFDLGGDGKHRLHCSTKTGSVFLFGDGVTSERIEVGASPLCFQTVLLHGPSRPAVLDPLGELEELLLVLLLWSGSTSRSVMGA